MLQALAERLFGTGGHMRLRPAPYTRTKCCVDMARTQGPVHVCLAPVPSDSGPGKASYVADNEGDTDAVH
jgi:hypothetical protein